MLYSDTMGKSTKQPIPALPDIPDITPTIDELKKSLREYRDKIPKLKELTDDRLDEILQNLYENSYNSDAGGKLKVDLDNLLDTIVEEIFA